jgi:PKD repeat protein
MVHLRLWESWWEGYFVKRHLCVLALLALMICGFRAEFASADKEIDDAKETVYLKQERHKQSSEGITIPPVADFQAQPGSGIVPLTVDFKNSSEYASSSRWDFGDGSRSTEESPSHTFIKAGSYTVSLTVKNGNLSDTKTTGITVKPVPPAVDFHAAPRKGNVPLKVVFINDSENATSFEWNFGDRTKSTDVNPVHTYRKAGSYSVTLKASNGDVSKAKTRKLYISVTAVRPNADFEATPQSGTAPLAVTFTNTSSNAASFLWDFGDGRRSKAENPVHGYKQAGKYTVRLIAKYKGKADIKTDYITVKQPPPKADFKGKPRSGMGSLTVAFTNTSTNATSFLWDFGDGTSGRGMNPTHEYKKAGSFTVSLTASRGAEKDTRTETDYITVNPLPPEAAFEGAPRSGSLPLVVSFKNNSSNATSYAWDFGDGSTGTQANPVHQYSQVGAYSVKLTAINGSLTNTKIEPSYINVSPIPPTADFMGTPRKGNCPLAVNFINTSINATGYLWDFGDGGSSQEKNPSHTYSGPGSFTVSLTASNGQTTHTKTLQAYITASELILPKADFEGTPLSGVKPLTVSFRNISTDATSFSWDFGDGATSTQEHPVHQYTSSGIFTVKLVAGRDDLSSTRSRPGYIAVTDPVIPHASFQATPRNGIRPLTVNFINTSSNALTYLWNFGDGQTSQLENPTHDYTESGSYTVTLMAINGDRTDTATQSNHIIVSDPVSPLADFSGTPLIGMKPLTVTFTNTSTNAESYLWDFGDGTTSTEGNPVHQYLNPGAYSVVLTAANGDVKHTKTRSSYVTVSEVPPEANFSGTPVNGVRPLTVNFINTSSNASSYLWDFGDGESSKEESPTHTYKKPGSFTVCLTAQKENLTHTKTEPAYITVTDPVAPVAGFTATPLTGARTLTVTFINTSTNAASFQWDFGDGGTSTDTNPVHSYTGSGSYTVSLTAINGDLKNTQTRADYITVGEVPPKAAFSGSPLSGTRPLTVNFINTSSNATAYLWDFGDGKSGTEQTPSHQYTRAGTYTVTLTAKNGNLTDTKTLSNYVSVADPVLPTASFTGAPLKGDPPLKVTFTNTSSNATSYKWSFGDGTTSTDQHPVHQFTSIGSFTVVLTAKNGSSADTMTKVDYVIVTSPSHDLESEPNDDSAHADRLTSDVPMTGQIASPTDLDYFYLSTSPMDLVPVVIQYNYYSSDESCIRYHVSVYDSSDTLLVGMPIMPTEDEEIALSFTAPAQANYHILVEAPLSSDLPACTDLAAAHLSDPYTLTASFLDPALSSLGFRAMSGPAQCGAGKTISVVNKVKNHGDEVSGPFSIRLYLSKNKKVDPAVDHLLRRYSINALEPGYTVKRTLRLAIPASLKPGTYYLGAMVDAPDILSEIDAINDSKAFSTQIQVVK